MQWFFDQHTLQFWQRTYNNATTKENKMNRLQKVKSTKSRPANHDSEKNLLSNE